MLRFLPKNASICIIESPEKINDIALNNYDFIILSQSCLYHPQTDVLQLFRHINQNITVFNKIIVQRKSFLWLLASSISRIAQNKSPLAIFSADFIQHAAMQSNFYFIGRKWDYHYTKSSSLIINAMRMPAKLLSIIPLVRQLLPYEYSILAQYHNSASKLIPKKSVSIIIPCKNEAGNIEPILEGIPKIFDTAEIIFIVAHGKDDTEYTITQAMRNYPEKNIKFMKQEGTGKKQAVFQAADAAHGEILIILDGDNTVPSSTLEPIYYLFTTTNVEFINVSRLRYPFNPAAMPVPNFLVNHLFAILMRLITHLPISDTLCGTKAWYKKDTKKILTVQKLYGNADPFGDFDLLFGASYNQLYAQEIACHYKARTYGQTQITYWMNGVRLCMLMFLFWWNGGSNKQ